MGKGRPLEQNHNWRGDDASYSAFHHRIGKVRGKPLRCERCGLADPDRRYEWANLTGNYGDVNDYERMCVPCHRKFDAKRSTHCSWGHPMSGDNLYESPGGQRQCRSCIRRRRALRTAETQRRRAASRAAAGAEGVA